MTNVVQITSRSAGKIKDRPIDLFALRWRMKLTSGVVITSSWTPETRYPSLHEALQQFDGRIETVFIDGSNRYADDKFTFLICPGAEMKALSYKAAVNLQSNMEVWGIELEHIDGTRYLILRNGSVNEFKAERIAHVSNND